MAGSRENSLMSELLPLLTGRELTVESSDMAYFADPAAGAEHVQQDSS